MYKCPDDSTANSNAGGVVNVPVSYAFNENLAGGGSTGALAAMNSSASTVLLCEVQQMVTEVNDPDNEEGATQGHHYSSPSADGLDANLNTAPADLINTNFGNDQFQTTKYASGPMGGIAASSAADFTGTTGIHSDGSNFLAADGHVKWLRGSAVSPGVAASAANVAQAADTGNKNAAGTGSLGNASLTFSPI